MWTLQRCSRSILWVRKHQPKRGGAWLLNATQYQRNPRDGHVYFGAIYFSQLHTAEPSSCTYSPDGTVATFQTALLTLIQVAIM
jgi:hypothetical protein